MRTLTVIKITPEDLEEHWGRKPVSLPAEGLYIRCNQNGYVNWDKAPVYTWDEIKKEQQRRPVHFSSGTKRTMDIMKKWVTEIRASRLNQRKMHTAIVKRTGWATAE